MSDEWKTRLPDFAELNEDSKTITVVTLGQALDVLEILPPEQDDDWGFIIKNPEHRAALELFRRGMRW